MLCKNSSRTGTARHRVYIIATGTTKRPPLAYTQNARAGRAHNGKRTINGKCGRRQRWHLTVTRLPHLLLPGTVAGLIYLPHLGLTRARVKTYLGREIIVPAVRGLTVGAAINCPRAPGSFIKYQNNYLRTPLCNLILAHQTKPTIATSPGTYTRSLHARYIKLPRARALPNRGVLYAQLGVNANHQWHHTNLGKAGNMKLIGKRPHVRNKAKNPCARATSPHRFKKTRARLPWAIN